MEVTVIDDVLNSSESMAMEELFTSARIPWAFFRNVNYGSKPPEGTAGQYGADDRFEDSFGFSTLVFPGNDVQSPWVQQCMMVFDRVMQRQGIRPTKMVRIKANLLVRVVKPTAIKPFTPHVDLPQPHWVVIYYINDSDGDTLLLDRTFPDWQNAEIIHRISPKRGRAILFDGRHYHCGTCPSEHDTRLVVNYNFV